VSSLSFPAHPFWDYSLALYSRAGVADACLELQDEFGLDVNIVLLCVWSGAEGPGELTAAELNECMVRGGQWQQEVVSRLRFVRRTLKHDNLGATSELTKILRPQVQAVEISAEHVEQLLLAQIVPVQRGVTGMQQAVSNIRAYFEAAGVASGGNSHAAVITVLSNAFPGSPAAELEALW
jgi:uncharacterized protein (TIGR02444 family)